MAFRFILQPLMAAIIAFLHGRRDARAGRSPYFWTVMVNRQERIGRLREGLNATARVILLGVIMDVIYQIIVLERFYPAESVIIAVLLGFVPYLVFRGVVTRIWRRWRTGTSPHQA
jgi:hypothetical protein